MTQHAADYRAPDWPGSPIVHLDLNGAMEVPDLLAYALTCGARLADSQPDDRWAVLLDPAGHPFCITPFSPFKS